MTYLRILIVVLAIGLMSFLADSKSLAAPKDAIVRINSGRVDSYGRRSEEGHGSGTVIYSGKYGSLILTNAHILPKGGRGYVTLYCPHWKREQNNRAKITVVKCSRDERGRPGYDLLLLHVDRRLPYVVPVAPPGYSVQKASSYGYDGKYQGMRGDGQPQRMVYANATVMRSRMGWKWTDTNRPTSPGHSGGGLISADGYLIGTNVGASGPDTAFTGRPQFDRGLYTSLHAIHKFIPDRWKPYCVAKGIYNNPQSSLQAPSQNTPQRPKTVQARPIVPPTRQLPAFGRIGGLKSGVPLCTTPT